MDRHQFDSEDREGMVGELTEQLLADWRRKLAADDKRATTDLQNTVLDQLSEADAASIFIQAVQDEVGAEGRFQALAALAMRAECEAVAIKAVDAMEQRRAESRDDNRISQAVAARMH